MGQNTQPGLRDAICSRLLAWKTNHSPPLSTSHFRGLQAALLSQDEIGWQFLLEGRVSNQWQGVQQQYYNWIASRKTGRRWVSLLIQKLWQVAWDQWEHRNGILHSLLVSNANTNQRRDQIRSEHGRGPGQLPLQDHALFRIPMQTLLDASPGIQSAWLDNISSSRARAATRDAEGFSRERRFLQRWLRR